MAHRWRELLEKTIYDHRHVPSMFSGGMDSVTLLLAAMAVGGRPKTYTFHLGAHHSCDSSAAQKMAKDLGLDNVEVVIPQNEGQLIKDILELMRRVGTRKKASIQCAHAIMYLAKAIQADGFTQAIVGTGAICLDDRKVSVILAESGEEATRAYRKTKLTDRYTDCGTGYMHRIAKNIGVVLEEPYSDEPLISYALALDFKDLNRPRQKGIALRAYPDFFRGGYWRRNVPLQVGSGIREYHDTLLSSKYNRRDSQAVIAIYNDLWKDAGL